MDDLSDILKSRFDIEDEYVVSESLDGERWYLVRLHPPGFVARLTERGSTEDIEVLVWLDPPPADISLIMESAIDAMNAYDENMDIT